MSNILEVLSQNIKVDKDKCIFCGKCVDVCIIDNLRMKLAPCRKACPLGLNCQGYAQLIVRGEEEKALEVIGEELPFPGILGRICHHPCESECNRTDVDGSGVDLRILKRYLADSHELVLKDIEPLEELDEKVAVIGGGPAGLMAAFTLRKKGYQVTIYEASNKLGGMLISCIPEFRLPEEVVQREAAFLHKLGVQIIYNTKIGKDISIDEIIGKYDAVIVSTGTQAAKKLGMAGENSQNIYNALDYLKQARQDKAILNAGRKVLVIGGGNTALNVAQTAYRLGADEVRVVCLEDCQNMPAYEWEVAEALEEGIMIEYGWGPKEFIVKSGQVIGVEFKRCCSVFDDEGKFAPLFSEGESQVFAAEAVIVAVGQEMDPELNLGSIEIKNGFVAADAVTKQTSVTKIFAAGDITVGPKSVADAMAQGREAAISVDRYLQNIPLEYGRDFLASCDIDFNVDLSKAEAIPRVRISKLEGKERATFAELEKGITKEQALMEAKRCLSCGEPYGKFRTCWSCLPCEVECPQEALYVKIPYMMK
ncbi:MAG: FAD-dependent oxidoreductase [Peptococcaceae bacterium]